MVQWRLEQKGGLGGWEVYTYTSQGGGTLGPRQRKATLANSAGAGMTEPIGAIRENEYRRIPSVSLFRLSVQRVFGEALQRLSRPG